ncbi:fatty acid--CoA ligase [Couchioplanes caeruleus]|uniref:Long-chain fatty acid--CoA ligase n=2 Tax=Couchioplanes caeruleus TaxID=56438 RepID=A0A1K0FMA8_9ACTN|nr:fatty acid--CoA ligase [Couchioplanes caeruleus]OJF13864.1 long-chain fatty acid--CoA ligase [Couchioplanes caeruleus subsp. caeruleus]ROP34159.1 fatty-acyl-CoA synthase [Couchioplanes caeruleus]
MRSTMMDTPLQVSRLLEHGSTVHATAEVVTWTGTDSGPSRITFAEVGRQAARLAHALRDDLGITGDQRVATLMWNNAEHLVAYLAVPSMGAVLHTLNIRLFPEQLVYIAHHAMDRVVIVDSALIPLLVGILPHLSTVEHVIVCGDADLSALRKEDVGVHRWNDLLAGRPDGYDWPVVDEDDAAALCYTSGTTGNPKGIAYSHRSVYLHSMEVCMAETFGLSPATRALCMVPMFHAMAWGLPYAALMSGSSLIMPDRFLQAAPLAAMIAGERPTLAGAVPTIFADLLAHLDAAPVDTSSLREVIVGGSACPPALMHAFSERHDIEVIHAWGMTETSPLGSVARPPAGVNRAEAWAYRYTQGRVPAGVQARIVDPAGEVMPVDGRAVGELEVRGPWITAGYLAEGESDPEKFRDGWLRTGDVGTLSADGYVTLTDRAKDVIKSGGEWISSVELENAIMAHPAVLEACVVGVPDDKWGERPLAAVVINEDAQVDGDALRGFLADKLARWQLPERWAFIEAVPKTSVGKFDKRRIRADYAAGDLPVTRTDG